MFRISTAAALAATALAASAALSTPAAHAAPAAALAAQPWMNTALAPVDRANALLAAMTPAEKLTMLHGGANCGYAGCVDANTRLGIPALRLQDGPLGVGDGATGVTQLAAPVAGAASWNTGLMRQYGETLGAEQWGKGTNVVLAPTINIVRDPRWGRAFEAFGEDPYLTGQMSAADIGGIQSQGPMAQVKHYAVYNQETRRNTTADNAVVGDRAEREIYLPAFETSVKQGGADSVMCSYSAVNGPFACENGPLQNQILKSQWGFDGFITSDWGATHSTVASATNGLDMEMPGAGYYGSALTAAVANGQVSQATIDDHARRVLTPMFRRGLFDRTQSGSLSATVTSAAHAAVTRQVAAEGSVLLKNANTVLPVPATTKSIAVVGTPLYQGGGSAGVNASATVTPVQGIQARAGSGVTVSYNPGTAATGITGPGGKCLDVAGANTANGTAVQLYDCNGTNAQTWTVGSDQDRAGARQVPDRGRLDPDLRLHRQRRPEVGDDRWHPGQPGPVPRRHQHHAEGRGLHRRGRPEVGAALRQRPRRRGRRRPRVRPGRGVRQQVRVRGLRPERHRPARRPEPAGHRRGRGQPEHRGGGDQRLRGADAVGRLGARHHRELVPPGRSSALRSLRCCTATSTRPGSCR